jgi:hypothetical protein
MFKSQHRNMKQQGNSSPSKVNSTNKDSSSSEKEETAIIELKKKQWQE